MKADAKPSAEKEALEWAIEFFRDLGDELTRDGSRKVAYDTETLFACTSSGGWKARRSTMLIWPVCSGFRPPATVTLLFLKLCTIAAELIERGEPLSGPLKTTIVKYLRRDPEVLR